MPAEKELLISTGAADVARTDGETLTDGFCIDGGSGSTSESQPVYWRVLPNRNLLQLCHQGDVQQIRQLEPRLMHLLCLLAAADGDVLTRDSLMEALWPRVVVNENSLTRAVSELRKALNVSAKAAGETFAGHAAALIETVPKRGYRLNANRIAGPAAASGPATTHPTTPDSVTNSGKKSAGAVAHQQLAPRRQAVSRLAWTRFPAVAAAMVISAALSSFWTINLTYVREPQALNPTDVREPQALNLTDVSGPQAPALEDRVLSDPSTLPEGLHWRESVHSESGSTAAISQPWINTADSSRITGSVLAPGGQMMAFIEEFPGQSQLKLRSLLNTDEAWTVFTSSSPITHLQWSPLDAGLLFTVEDADGVGQVTLQDRLANATSSGARLSRLMLLDLETLQVRELYRRIVPSGDDQIRTVGSLT